MLSDAVPIGAIQSPLDEHAKRPAPAEIDLARIDPAGHYARPEVTHLLPNRTPAQAVVTPEQAGALSSPNRRRSKTKYGTDRRVRYPGSLTPSRDARRSVMARSTISIVKRVSGSWRRSPNTCSS